MSWFGSAFGPAAVLEISLSNAAGRPTLRTGEGAEAASLPIYSSGEDVCGDLKITIPGTKKLEHIGIKIELKGVVETFGEKSSITHEFCSAVRELASPGILTGTRTLPFVFDRVDMPYETYDGIHARCRYFIRAVISRTGFSASNLVKELEVAVHNAEADREVAGAGDSAVKLEVGIEDCLHIEFEYDRTRYHLSDEVTGRVHFLLVRIKIKYMEVALIRRETVGSMGGATSTESETLTRFEVMDGCPVKGENIPIRLYLEGLGGDLTPSYQNVANSYTVRYFLNLVLVDEEDRRYFKQQEITLWRREIKDIAA